MATQTDKVPEEIEGLGDAPDASWGDYPIDELLIRNESQAVEQVLGRIEQGRYVMDPDFQRDFIWDEAKQSKLIESVLMRIPLPRLLSCGRPAGTPGGGRRFAATVHISAIC